MKFRARGQAKIVGQARDQLGVAAPAQGFEHAALEFLILAVLDDLGQFGHGSLDRSDDVAGQQFGKIMKQGGKKIVQGASRAGADTEAEIVGERGHQKEMA